MENRCSEVEEAEFRSRIREAEGCWKWTGRSGVFNYQRKTYKPARLAYLLLKGREPEWEMRRVCGTPECANPEHYRPRKALAEAGVQERFWSKVDKSGECWEWQGASTPAGYGVFRLNEKNRPAHRLSWEWANGPVPEGLNVLHHCDNPPCVRPDHLFLGTQKDNSRDMVEKGRQSFSHPRYGEKNPAAKLTEEDVRTIRRRKAEGVSNYRLAKDYGVDKSLITRILDGRLWSHVI